MSWLTQQEKEGSTVVPDVIKISRDIYAGPLLLLLNLCYCFMLLTVKGYRACRRHVFLVQFSVTVGRDVRGCARFVGSPGHCGRSTWVPRALWGPDLPGRKVL